MVSYAEFAQGIKQIVSMSDPVLEQIFSVMDHKQIGLISYQEFLDVLKDHKIDPPKIVDSFDWE